MKSIALLALGVAGTKAQMQEFDSLFRQFGACSGADFGSTSACTAAGKAGAQCCDFVVVQDSTITGQFCVNDKQMQGLYTGTYRDYDYTLWKWQCRAPDSSDVVEKETTGGTEEDVGVYSNYEDKIMEWVLWVTYLSQELWVLGWPVSIPLGMGYISWLWLVGFWQFIGIFMGKGDFGGWFVGPFLSYFIVQPWLIFLPSVVISIIPGVNFLSAFLFGWWANLDYYQYNYELFNGPKLPGSQ